MTALFRRRLGALGLLGLSGCAPDIQYAALDPSPASVTVTALRIAPDSARLTPGDTVRFRATTLNSRGQVQPATGVTFSTTGGTISSGGLYRASDPGSYQVQARYRKGSTVWTATAPVEIEGTAPPPPPPGSLGLNADLHPRRLFPADNAWNQPVDTAQVDPNSAAIIEALKTHGMIVADSGSDWYLSGVANARWNDAELNTLKQLRGGDFEVIRMVGVVTP